MQIEMLLIKNELITFPLVLGRLGGPARTRSAWNGDERKIYLHLWNFNTLEFLSAAQSEVRESMRDVKEAHTVCRCHNNTQEFTQWAGVS